MEDRSGFPLFRVLKSAFLVDSFSCVPAANLRRNGCEEFLLQTFGFFVLFIQSLER